MELCKDTSLLILNAIGPIGHIGQTPQTPGDEVKT